MIKVAFSKRSAARSIAEKVAVLMEVKSFSLKEWISEKNTDRKLIVCEYCSFRHVIHKYLFYYTS